MLRAVSKEKESGTDRAERGEPPRGGARGPGRPLKGAALSGVAGAASGGARRVLSEKRDIELVATPPG